MFPPMGAGDSCLTLVDAEVTLPAPHRWTLFPLLRRPFGEDGTVQGLLE